MRRKGRASEFLFREKIMAGLAGYVEDGKLSAEGIERACAGLLTFRKILQTLQIENVRIFCDRFSSEHFQHRPGSVRHPRGDGLFG